MLREIDEKQLVPHSREWHNLLLEKYCCNICQNILPKNHHILPSNHKICRGDCYKQYTSMLQENTQEEVAKLLETRKKNSKFRNHILDDGTLHCGTCQFLNSNIHHQLMTKSIGNCIEIGKENHQIAG